MDRLEQLQNALRNAHSAGDTAAAQRLAQEINSLQNSSVNSDPSSLGVEVFSNQGGLSVGDMDEQNNVLGQTIFQNEGGRIVKTPSGVHALVTDQGFTTNNDDLMSFAGVEPSRVFSENYLDNYQGTESSALGVPGHYVQGGLMGFGDEVIGSTAATMAPLFRPFNKERYDERVPHSWEDRRRLFTGLQRKDLDSFKDAKPGQALASELGGGVVTALATGGGARVAQGTTMMGRMGRGAAEGLGYGMVAGAGYGDGETLGERAVDAAQGGAFGTLFGGAAPLATAAGGSIYRALSDRVRNNMGPAASQAMSRLQSAARNAGLSREQLQQKLASLGPEGALMDILGAPGHALARTTANLNPAARETLEDAVRTRTAGQTDRLADSLMDASGMSQPRTLQELQSAASDAARPQINQAYQQAAAAGQALDAKEVIGELAQSPMFQNAHRQASQLAQDRAVSNASNAVGPQLPAVADDVTRMAQNLGAPVPQGAGVAGATGPKIGASVFDVLDETKKTLDAQALPNLGQPQTNAQSIAGGLSSQLRSRMDEALPEYGGARDMARQLFARQDAMDLGSKAAAPRIGSDTIRQAQNVAPELRGDVAQGYASQMIDRALNRKSTAGAVDALFGPRRQQDSMRAALGDGAETVQRQIDAERAFAQTDNAVRGGSTTARQLADSVGGASTMAGVTGVGAMAAGPVGAIASLIAQKLTFSGLRGARRANEAQVGPILAEMLTSGEIPEQLGAQIQQNPTIRHMITRLVAMQMQSGEE